MTKIRNITACCSIIFLLSCSHFQKEESGYEGKIDCKEINVNLAKDSILPLSYIKKCLIVPLETNENSIFGSIRKLKVTEDRIFILDSDVSQVLLAFDREGKYLMKIGDKGNGPGEYYSINDFFIDAQKQEIIINDANLRQLHYYAWNGNFIRTHSLSDFWLQSCCPLDSTDYALDFSKRARGQNKFYLKLADQNNEVYFQYKHLDADHQFANNDHIAFYNGLNKLFYVPIRCDTIFSLSDSGIDGGYAVNFGKYRLPADFDKKTPSEEHDEALLKSEYCYGIKNVLETDKLLCFSFSYGQFGFSSFYVKNTERNYIQLQYLPSPVASYQEYCVGYFEKYSFQVIHSLDKEYIDEWKNVVGENNWNLMQNMNESDNPLIVFYEINPDI